MADADRQWPILPEWGAFQGVWEGGKGAESARGFPWHETLSMGSGSRILEGGARMFDGQG